VSRLRGVVPLTLAVSLFGCHHGPPRLDLQLPEAQGSVEARSALEVLQTAAGSDEPSLRGPALSALLSSGPADELQSWATVCAYDPSASVRGRCVAALGGRDDLDAQGILTAWLASDTLDPVLRGHAGLRLAELGKPAGGDALSVAWHSEHRPFRRLPLALAALALGDTTALSTVRRDLASGEVPMDLRWLEAVGDARVDGLVDALSDAMADVEPELELPLAQVLAWQGAPRGFALLRRAALSDDEDRAMEALDALVLVQNKGATGILKRVAHTSKGLPRDYARMALPSRGLGDVASLVAGAQTDSIERRLIAVGLAGRTWSAQQATARAKGAALAVLTAGVTDEASSVRERTLRSLHGQLPAPLRAIVQERLTDEDSGVRVAAAAVLFAQRAP